MSIGFGFSIGFGVGTGVSLLFGAPLAPAIFLGLVTGGFGALIAAAPSGPRAVTVTPGPAPQPWYTQIGFSYLHPRPRNTVVVTNNSGFSWRRPRSWFPQVPPSAPGSVTTIHQTPGSAPLATTTIPTQQGGTIISSTTAVPTHAHNVRSTTTLFQNPAPTTPVVLPSSPIPAPVTGSVLGAQTVVPPTAQHVRQTTTLVSPPPSVPVPSTPAPRQSSLMTGLGSILSAPTVVPFSAHNVRSTTTTFTSTTTPSATFLSAHPRSGTTPVSAPVTTTPTSSSGVTIMSAQPQLPSGARVTSVKRRLFS